MFQIQVNCGSFWFVCGVESDFVLAQEHQERLQGQYPQGQFRLHPVGDGDNEADNEQNLNFDSDAVSLELQREAAVAESLGQ